LWQFQPHLFEQVPVPFRCRRYVSINDGSNLPKNPLEAGKANGLRYLRVDRHFDKLSTGVDSAWEQEKLEARKILDAKRAARPSGSPTLPALSEANGSGVCMKSQPTGLRSGTFLGMLPVFSERERVPGNAALGTSRNVHGKFQS